MKKLKDLFNDSHKWISTIAAILAVGDWSTVSNAEALDARLYDFYGEKVLDYSFQNKTNAEINASVTAFINSQVYKLDGLFHTTDQTYNPIENYNMQESGRDETRSTSGGSTTDYSTSYASTTEAETGKSEASGSSNTALIHSFSRSGNIGVTTTQQMLQAEREVSDFDFIGYLAELIVTNYTTSEYFPVSDMLEVIL